MLFIEWKTMVLFSELICMVNPVNQTIDAVLHLMNKEEGLNSYGTACRWSLIEQSATLLIFKKRGVS